LRHFFRFYEYHYTYLAEEIFEEFLTHSPTDIKTMQEYSKLIIEIMKAVCLEPININEIKQK